MGVPMYAVVGETLGADEFEAKFFKGKVGLNNFVRNTGNTGV